MGGCTSKPKDLDTKEAPAPETAPAAATTSDQEVQVEAVPQENKDGDETKKEEPLVDVSEAAPESEKTEEKQAVEEPPKEEEKAGEDSAPKPDDTHTSS